MIAAALLFAGLVSQPFPKDFDPDAAWVYTAQERVAWRLRDHGSQFSGSRTYRGSGFPVVCGGVTPSRAKKAQRFIVVGEQIMLELAVGQPSFDFTWYEFCR